MPTPTALTISQGKRREDSPSSLPQAADNPQSPTTGDKRKRLNGSQKRKKKKERDANREPNAPSSSKNQIDTANEPDQDAEMSDATVSTEPDQMDEDAPGPGMTDLKRHRIPHSHNTQPRSPTPTRTPNIRLWNNRHLHPQLGTKAHSLTMTTIRPHLLSVSSTGPIPTTTLTRTNPPPGHEVQSHIPYTMAQFPRLIKSQAYLLGGIRKDDQEKIKASPEDYIALLVHGAGDALRSENPRLAPDVQIFIRSLCDPGMQPPKVTEPPKENKDSSSEWGKPHILLCREAAPELREYLLWFQTFAFEANGRRIAVSALPLDEGIHSWYICDLSSTYIDGEEETRLNVRRAIVNTLKVNPQFRNFVDSCVGTLDPRFPTLDDRVNRTLQTFKVYEVELAQDVRILQLFAEPIAIDGKTHSTWIELITTQRYIVDFTELQVQTKLQKNRLYESCTFCKDDTHDVSRCPFPLTEDWKGPFPAEVAQARSPLWYNPQGPLTRGGSGSRARGRGYTRGRGRGMNRGQHRGRNSPSRGRGRGIN
ncbi:hypothetical protein ONZ45_g9283 [Pleurotus djamor]|nr:hypothetical protein ONZ45_g9283 [Pleurotus djamor]